MGLLLAVALARLIFQSGALAIDLDEQAPCPDSARHARPYLFHFAPGVQEHQSWIEARVPEPDATNFVLCKDGHLVAQGIGQTPHQGIVDVSVRTTWVDLQWALGALDLYAAPGRWEIGYTTYTLMNEQASKPAG